MAPQLSFPVQPPSPVINRASPLAQGCIFALPFADRGFSTASLEGEEEYIQHIRGNWEFSVDQDSYGIYNGGHNVRNGFGGSDDRIIYDAPLATSYDVPGNRDISIAALVRPQTLGQADANPPFSKIKHRNSGTAGIGDGWGFFTDGNNPGVWEFLVRKTGAGGGASRTAVSTTPLNVNESRMLVGRVSQSLDETAIFVDGVKEGTDTAPDDAGNVDTNINILSDDQNRRWLGEISVAMMWGRALSDSEVASLTSDPWALWRQPQGIDGPIPVKADAPSGANTYFLAI